MSIIPIIGADSEGGVVDAAADGRTVTFNLTAKTALPMREILAVSNPVPFLLAALTLAVLSEIAGVKIKLGKET